MNPIYVGDPPHRVQVRPGGPDGDGLSRCWLTCSLGCLLPVVSPIPVATALVLADQHLRHPRPVLPNP